MNKSKKTEKKMKISYHNIYQWKPKNQKWSMLLQEY